jgi:hypothetical protein
MTIEELIRAANPVPPGDVPAGDSPSAQRLLARLRETPPARRPLRRPTARAALAGLAAAGLAAAVVAVAQPGSPGHPPARARAGGPGRAPAVTWLPGPVGQDLRTLVLDAARQSPVPVPGRGQYQYVEAVALNESDSLDPPAYSVQYSERTQSWVGWNGSGRQVQIWTDPHFPTAIDRAHWIAAGRRPLTVSPSDVHFGPHQLAVGVGFADLSKVTTDPARLARLISSRRLEGGPPGPAEDFVQVGDLLRAAATPPALRAALFQVAAHIPGVTVVANAPDHSGRVGIGLVYHNRSTAGPLAADTVLQELIFSPATSGLIAEQYTTVNPRTHVSTVDSWTDYLVTTVVDSTTVTTPAAGGQ